MHGPQTPRGPGYSRVPTYGATGGGSGEVAPLLSHDHPPPGLGGHVQGLTLGRLSRVLVSWEAGCRSRAVRQPGHGVQRL